MVNKRMWTWIETIEKEKLGNSMQYKCLNTCLLSSCFTLSVYSVWVGPSIITPLATDLNDITLWPINFDREEFSIQNKQENKYWVCPFLYKQYFSSSLDGSTPFPNKWIKRTQSIINKYLMLIINYIANFIFTCMNVECWYIAWSSGTLMEIWVNMETCSYIVFGWGYNWTIPFAHFIHY